jgi:hypothetical protein
MAELRFHGTSRVEQRFERIDDLRVVLVPDGVQPRFASTGDADLRVVDEHGLGRTDV